MERRAIAIQGIVQGVGFRPFVHGLAAQFGLGGFIQNKLSGVLIEVEGDGASLDGFVRALDQQAPPLAQLAGISWERRPPRGECGFRIETSEADHAGAVFLSPDVATCDRCVEELFDPADRRFAYPFLNCTDCGPRLTIVTGAPYDRERTTMAGFAMCPACRAEYENPADRRFHAQPSACARCGPRLELFDAQGNPVESSDPLAFFADALHAGQIGALKGLGGYHLACDARNGAAVSRLRARKAREEKPFALMVPDLAAALALCEVQPAEADLLHSPRRPIVLLPRRPDARLPDAVAPGNPYLGVMLPYTPLHHLLLKAVGGIPLVMTSGNRSDEPIAYENAEAIERLAGIADLFLAHNRPIHVRCDDSVSRVVAGRALPFRRSRGYAPEPIGLPMECDRPILAVGGQLKATFALGRGRHAFLSHHLGDLDHFQAYHAFERDIALYERLFAVRPALLAHDLHPDYASTRYATARADSQGLERIAIQHHHAHLASCLAENGLDAPAIGVVFDGSGYGTDGTIWGGEFLLGDYRGFERLAHLRPVGLPGGAQAIREPWRVALAHLEDAGARCEQLEARQPLVAMRAVKAMLERRFNTPMASSAGRLFDAVAALVGVRDRTSYEGQAAIELEWLAMRADEDEPYPVAWAEAHHGDAAAAPLQIDTRPLIRAIVADLARGAAPARVARRFHASMADLVAACCDRLREATGINAVALSGGVFMNRLLTEDALERLRATGFRVYTHHRVPPNDGGLCLGQLAIAARSRGAPPARATVTEGGDNVPRHSR